MAKVYSTGPALIYVQPPPYSSPQFFGTGETAPDIEIDPGYVPVMNDLGGSTKPFDRVFDGQEGVVSIAPLNRFNAVLLASLQSLPNPAASGLGINVSGDVGTLMGQEGCTYPIWIRFPYNQKPAYSDMIPGYHFYSAFLIGPHRIKPGTRDEKVHVIFQCQRGFSLPAQSGSPGSQTVTVTAPGVGTFALYDTLAASFAGLPPIN